MKRISFTVFFMIALISGDHLLNGQLPCGDRCVNVSTVKRRVLTGTPSISIDFCDKHANSAGWTLRTTRESDGAFRLLPDTHTVWVLAGDACTPLCSGTSEATSEGGNYYTILYTVNLENSECYASTGS